MAFCVLPWYLVVYTVAIVYIMVYVVHYMQATETLEDVQPHNDPINCVTGVNQCPVTVVSQPLHSHISAPITQPQESNEKTMPFSSLWSAGDPN